MLANSIKVFDGSVNLGVEYSNLNHQELMEIGKNQKNMHLQSGHQITLILNMVYPLY